MSERIAIILPNRVGDALLAVPLVRCLQDLVARYGPPGRTIEAYTSVPLLEVLRATGVQRIARLGAGTYLQSWLTPPDQAYFLIAASQNAWFRARHRSGLRQGNKWYVHYDRDLPFLRGEPMAAELRQHLVDCCRLPDYAVNLFGIIPLLGYGVEQVRQAFAWDPFGIAVGGVGGGHDLPLARPYVVICPEAAYGSKRNAGRRWPFAHYLALAEWVVANSPCQAVFIGLEPKPPVGSHQQFTDLRGKLSLWQLYQVLAGAVGYVGNDTGPLHLANVAGIPSIGIYSSEDHHAPLFGQRNIVVMRPPGPDAVYPLLARLLGTAP